jgi:hypothetical protein
VELRKNLLSVTETIYYLSYTSFFLHSGSSTISLSSFNLSEPEKSKIVSFFQLKMGFNTFKTKIRYLKNNRLRIYKFDNINNRFRFEYNLLNSQKKELLSLNLIIMISSNINRYVYKKKLSMTNNLLNNFSS